MIFSGPEESVKHYPQLKWSETKSQGIVMYHYCHSAAADKSGCVSSVSSCCFVQVMYDILTPCDPVSPHDE